MISNDSSRTHQSNSKSTSPTGRYRPRTPKIEPPTIANGMPVNLNNLQRIVPNKDNIKTETTNKAKITEISEVSPLPRMIDDELDSSELISGREDFPPASRAVSPQNISLIRPEPLSSSSSRTIITSPRTNLEEKPITSPIIFPPLTQSPQPLSPQPLSPQPLSPQPTNISLSKASNLLRRKKDIGEVTSEKKISDATTDEIISGMSSNGMSSSKESLSRPVKSNDGLKLRSVSPTRNNFKKITPLTLLTPLTVNSLGRETVVNQMSTATPIKKHTEKVLEPEIMNRVTRRNKINEEDYYDINQSSDDLQSSPSMEPFEKNTGRRRRGLSPIRSRYERNSYNDDFDREEKGRYYKEERGERRERSNGSRSRKTNRRRRERIYEEEDNLEKVPPISDWYHTLRPKRPDFSRMSPGQRYKERNKLLGKYDQLRQLGPTFKIPDPPNHWTLEEIYDDYEAWLKKCFLGKKISSYTKYLYTSLLLVEKIGSRFLGLPMKGFMASQQQEIASYQLLLMEMGESIGASVNSKGVVVATGSTWPVTVRLGLTLLGNTIMFIIIKLAIKWFGATPVKKLIDMFRDDSGSKIANIELNETDEPGKLNVGNDNAEKFINQLSNTVEFVDKISGNDTESKPRRRRRERLANPEFDE